MGQFFHLPFCPAVKPTIDKVGRLDSALEAKKGLIGEIDILD